MTRIVSGFLYYILYSILYSLPLMIIFIITAALNIDPFKYFEQLGSFKQIVGMLLIAYVIILPGYRAKLAADTYGDRDMKFWEAHSASGALFKAHLSFLPVIGIFFKEKN